MARHLRARGGVDLRRRQREVIQGGRCRVAPAGELVQPGTAVAVVDASTALYGSPAAVRRAIDARKGKAPAVASSGTLVDAYGQSDPTRPVRLGLLLDSVVKAQLAADPTDPFVKMLAPIRYVFGTAGVTRASCIAAVTVAIDFGHKPGSDTGEIRKEGTDGMLPPEFRARPAPRS